MRELAPAGACSSLIKENNPMDTPSIYVACLASYNSGFLHGKWISADQTVSAIYDEIKDMLEESPVEDAEEHAIHDYEGFGNTRLGEYEDLETVVKYAGFITEHGELGQALLSEYDIEDAENMMSDQYHGCYDSEVDFAWHLFEECYSHTLPDNLRYYFDCEAFARDLFINDYCSVDAEGKTFVFSRY